MTIRRIPISDFSFEVFQGSGAFYMRRECLPQLCSSDTGADPGRNLTRAQQKDRGRGYMGVENIP